MTLKVEEFSEERADKEALIETKYTGQTPSIRGTKGEAFYAIQDKQWFYRPEYRETDGTRVEWYNTWYRVSGKNLSCNQDSGWIKVNYKGVNSHAGKEGRAKYNEEEAIWEYQPKASKDLFRIKNESSLEFLRS